ncbi:DNA repair and recombination protein RAD52 [Acrasis kona]|uniref:DNA repair and recombination protein RAD52 n=1 Tax=Acrasis kona TaxID=1008807 RepID=A0AAW2YIC4_9EUKA
MDIVKTEGGSESKTQLPFGTIQFSDDERLFLQNQLENKLTQEDISKRPGPNGTPVYYIETWRAIEIANQTFGFNGWSSRIMETTTDYLEQVETTGKFNVGVSATVRIMLKDGCFHEDLGYGTAENQKYKGAAIEHAKKKAVSDGLKRALRNFGNALGLTIYDKTHIDKVKRESRRAKTNVVEQPKLINPHFSHTQSSSNSTQANETSTQQLLTSQTQHAAQLQHSTPPNPDPTEASLSKIKAETNDIKSPPNSSVQDDLL